MVWKVANHKVFVLPALLYKIVHSDFFPFPMYVWEGYGDLILGTGLVTGTQSHTCRPLCWQTHLVSLGFYQGCSLQL